MTVTVDLYSFSLGIMAGLAAYFSGCFVFGFVGAALRDCRQEEHRR
jgi:hypothetical protein